MVQAFRDTHGAWPAKIQLPDFAAEEMKRYMHAADWESFISGHSVRIAFGEDARIRASDAGGHWMTYGDQPEIESHDAARRWLGSYW